MTGRAPALLLVLLSAAFAGSPFGGGGGASPGVLPNDSVSYAEIVDASGQNAFLCRKTASAGDWEDCTQAQATAALAAATTSLCGVVFTTATRIMWQAGSATSGDTNSPAAPAKHEWLAAATSRRLTADLTGRTSCRAAWQASTTTGAAGSRMGFQYSIDAGSTWVYLDGTADGAIAGTTPIVNYDTAAGTLYTTGWATLHAAARTEVLLRAVTSGDGTVDPLTLFLWIECR